MDNKIKNFISAVVYVHNAKEEIEHFLTVLTEVLRCNFEYSEIICVNDSSEDDSINIIKNTSKKISDINISVINMSCYHGVEAAMCAGTDMAIGDFVFEFDDAVIDYEPELIMNVYNRSIEGYDVVSASPDKKERVSSRIFYNTFEHFSKLTLRMTTEKFRILSRRVINRINSMNRTVSYRKVLYADCGLNTDIVKYVPIRNTSVRKDKKEIRYRSLLATDSLLLFTEVGYRFSMAMTIIMMLMSLVMTIYSVVTYLLFHPVAGWTTTILFLSVAFFGLFGILTIIVKYLQLLINAVFKRKYYTYESIEKLTK